MLPVEAGFPFYAESNYLLGQFWLQGSLGDISPDSAYSYFRVAQEAGFAPAAEPIQKLEREFAGQGPDVLKKSKELEEQALARHRELLSSVSQEKCSAYTNFQISNPDTGEVRDGVNGDPALGKAENQNPLQAGAYVLELLKKAESQAMRLAKDGKDKEASKALEIIDEGIIKNLLLARQLPVPTYTPVYDEYVKIHAQTLVTGSEAFNIDRPQDVLDLFAGYPCERLPGDDVDKMILRFSDILLSIAIDQYKRGDEAYAQKALELTKRLLSGSRKPYSWEYSQPARGACYYFGETTKTVNENGTTLNSVLERYQLAYQTLLSDDVDTEEIINELSSNSFGAEGGYYQNHLYFADLVKALIVRGQNTAIEEIVNLPFLTPEERAGVIKEILKAEKSALLKPFLENGGNLENTGFYVRMQAQRARTLYEGGEKEAARHLLEPLARSYSGNREPLLAVLAKYEDMQTIMDILGGQEPLVGVPNYYDLLKQQLLFAEREEFKEITVAAPGWAPEMVRDNALIPQTDKDFIQEILIKIDPSLDLRRTSYEEMLANLKRQKSDQTKHENLQKRKHAVSVLSPILEEMDQKLKGIAFIGKKGVLLDQDLGIGGPPSWTVEEWYAPENQDIRNYKNLQAFVIYLKDYKPQFGRGYSYLTLAKLKAREGDFSAAQNLFSQWETIREDLRAELEAEVEAFGMKEDLNDRLLEYQIALDMAVYMLSSPQKDHYKTWIEQTLKRVKTPSTSALVSAEECFVGLMSQNLAKDVREALLTCYSLDGRPLHPDMDHDGLGTNIVPDVAEYYHRMFNHTEMMSRDGLPDIYQDIYAADGVLDYSQTSFALARLYLESGNTQAAENLLLDIIDIPRTIFTSARMVLFEQKKDRVLLEIVYGLCVHERCDETPQYIERISRSGTRNAAWTMIAMRMRDQGKIDEANLYAKNIVRSLEGPTMTGSRDNIKDRRDLKTLFSQRAELFDALSMRDEAQYYRAILGVF